MSHGYRIKKTELMNTFSRGDEIYFMQNNYIFRGKVVDIFRGVTWDKGTFMEIEYRNTQDRLSIRTLHDNWQFGRTKQQLIESISIYSN